jgi:D-glycero-alpha-D-manno-heptose-7-phosphate kinase
MIITRTPVRISFLGGGTDYPDYFRHSTEGGQTLGVAIDKYSYVLVTPLSDFFDYTLRVGYSLTELAKTVDEIQHPAVREGLRFMGLESHVEIDYWGDLPARTGLGSSSSFTVGLLHGLHAYKGESIDQATLAHEAVYVEQQMIGERVGVQDQYICACGGLLHLHCYHDGAITAEPLSVEPERLTAFHDRLLLVYTGVRRYAHEVLGEQLERTRNGANTDHLRHMSALVDEGIGVLRGRGDLTAFGELLHESWMLKRSLSSTVSSSMIDDAYDRARKSGAVGGKLLGAGGGGFLLLFVEPDRRAAVLGALEGLKPVDFQFDTSGSQVIVEK